MFRKQNNEEETHIFWISYTDFMLSFSAIFIVIAMYFAYQYFENNKNIPENKTQKGSGYRELEKELDSILKAENIDAEVHNGAVRFYSTENRVLFDEGKEVINSKFNTTLHKFFPKFLGAIREKQNSIKEIRVEGHTSQTGSYEYNLDLSNRRANNVLLSMLNYMNKNNYDTSFINFIRKNTISCGFSFSKTLETDDKSRRVEFRVLLK